MRAERGGAGRSQGRWAGGGGGGDQQVHLRAVFPATWEQTFALLAWARIHAARPHPGNGRWTTERAARWGGDQSSDDFRIF